MSQYQRWQSKIVKNALKTRRVVIIGGARQSGKTTISKLLAVPGVAYRTLDDDLLLNIAKTDPQSFVRHPGHLMIIDEVQKAVQLLPAIKMRVDADNRPGQYLLTGSAHIQSLPAVTESLAGRIREVPLRPLSHGEILGHQPNFLKDAFQQKFHEEKKNILNRDEIIEIAMRGGYPEVLQLPSDERELWHRNYIKTLFDRDLREIINIRRRDAMNQLMQVVAAWSTKPIDIVGISSGLFLQRHTVENYFNALETLYLIDRIPAFSKTDYDRIGRQSKLILNDSGLMSSILRWRIDEVRLNGDRVGKLIETHVGNELQKHVDSTEERYTLYHYRDRERREIDFLIENYDGDLLGIEVKATTTPSSEDFKHLRWFQENIAPKNKKFTGIVLYTGQYIGSFGGGMWVVPIPCLY